MNNTEMKYLIDLTSRNEVNTVQIVYLQNIIKIGKVRGMDVFCSAVEGSFHCDKISLRVLFNKHDDKLYGERYDSGIIGIYESDYISDSLEGIEIDSDFVKNIILEITNDYGFIHSQNVIRNRKNMYAKIIHGDKTLSWTEKLEYHKECTFMENLSNRVGNCLHKDTLKEMEKLGRVEFTKLAKQRADFCNEIMNEIIAEEKL